MITGLTMRSSASLRRRRRQLVKRLPSLRSIFRGSLVERYKPCGKPRCTCAQGPGHGPKYYLSVSRSGGRPEMDYVPLDWVDQVRQGLVRYQRIRHVLEEIGQINRELLRRRDPL